MRGLSIAIVLLTAAPVVLAADPANTGVVADAGGASVVVDEGELLDACSTMLAGTTDAARIALLVIDDNAPRKLALERSLVRAMRDRRREDVVTPAMVAARLGDSARAQLEGQNGALQGVAADHVIVAEVTNTAEGASLALRLIQSESGQVKGTARVALIAGDAAPSSSARTQDIRVAAADLADLAAEAVERTGADPRTHRIAVPPASAEGAAKEARVDRLIQTELASALRDRGFLVVERAQLAAAMDQLALAQLTDTDSAGTLGKTVGAQSVALTSVAEAADTFLINVRIVGVESGDVLGAARATIKRDNVVSMAAVETRTGGEAATRSALAPGWGQAYNGESAKALAFGVGTYGALAATVGLGVGAAVSYNAYLGVTKSDDVSAAEAAQQAVSLRQQTNVLVTATAVAGLATVSVWGFNVLDAWLSPSD